LFLQEENFFKEGGENRQSPKMVKRGKNIKVREYKVQKRAQGRKKEGNPKKPKRSANGQNLIPT